MTEIQMTDYCTWTLKDFGSDAWESECNSIFTLEDGTPHENGMKYCCFCGGQLLEQILCDEEDKYV